MHGCHDVGGLLTTQQQHYTYQMPSCFSRYPVSVIGFSGAHGPVFLLVVSNTNVYSYTTHAGNKQMVKTTYRFFTVYTQQGLENNRLCCCQ